jgi:hypothetical protein
MPGGVLACLRSLPETPGEKGCLPALKKIANCSKLTIHGCFVPAKLALLTSIPSRKRPIMLPYQRRTFPHRLNPNGSYDSICTECHLTVASSSDEAGLAGHERDHACNPIRLYQLAEDQSESERPSYSY